MGTLHLAVNVWLVLKSYAQELVARSASLLGSKNLTLAAHDYITYY